MSRTTTHAVYDQANKVFARLRFYFRIQSSLIGSLEKDDLDNSENVTSGFYNQCVIIPNRLANRTCANCSGIKVVRVACG